MLPELKGIPLPDSREAYDLVTAHGKKFDEAYILEKASVDATLNIPALDSEELTSFEKQLLHETSLLANKVAIQFRKSLELIDAVIKAEESAFTTVKEYQDSDLTEHNTNFIDDVQNSYQPKEVSRRIAQAEARYNEFYEKFKRPPTVYIPHWLYIILALVIFVGEIPLNALVFQIFGENQIMTWIMATIIGLSVPLIAHFIGIKFREHPNRIDLANLVKGIIALTVVVAALYGLSVMRQTYLGENKDALGLTDNLVASSFMFYLPMAPD